MSATLALVDLDKTIRHLKRDHIPHGVASTRTHVATSQIEIGLDNVTDLEQAAADLHLASASMVPNRWSGWHGEVWLILWLDVPRGPFPAQGGRAAR